MTTRRSAAMVERDSRTLAEDLHAGMQTILQIYKQGAQTEQGWTQDAQVIDDGQLIASIEQNFAAVTDSAS
ncbi:MAG: hypothetical protein ABJ251_13850 [Paracoccaceae bacterium]